MSACRRSGRHRGLLHRAQQPAGPEREQDREQRRRNASHRDSSQKAFYAGELSVTGAFLIAWGVPTALQAEAWARMKQYAEQDAYDEELGDEGHSAPMGSRRSSSATTRAAWTRPRFLQTTRASSRPRVPARSARGGARTSRSSSRNRIARTSAPTSHAGA